MKTRLPLFFLFVTLIGYSQTPISKYDSAAASVYAVLQSTPPIDQTPAVSGATTWTFTNFSSTESATDTHLAPTTSEQNIYPGTTSVATVTNGSNIRKVYTKKVANTLSITGVIAEGLTLNFITNNGLLGTFPLNYGYSNTDDVSGTYKYVDNANNYEGDFDGTLKVSADAYGTLVMNDFGAGAFNGSVTRLKSVQDLNLDYSFFSDFGKVTQTTYSYYDASNGNLVFRTNEVKLVVSFLSINESAFVMESLLLNPLSVDDANFSEGSLTISPNPTNDFLNLGLNNHAKLRSITISDISGRQVLKLNTNKKTVAVSQLKSGIYIVSVTTDNGILSRKFVKR